jgi:hypothetical protein
MWLDLYFGDDQYKKHLVVHQFGHVLGLQHEHQRPDFWRVIQKYIDKEKMMHDLRIPVKDSDLNWGPVKKRHFDTGKYTVYDPDSVMHYW